MTSNVQPPSEARQSSERRMADRQARAQARTAIGLEPERATAPDTYLRPPEEDSRGAQWLLFTCVAVLGLAVLLLVLASLLAPNSTLASLFGTRVTVQSGVVPAADSAPTAGAAAGAIVAPALPSYLSELPGLQLWFNDDFAAPSAVTAAAPSDSQVAASLLERGVYRLQVPPNQLGWTLFDLAQTTAYHLETSATLDAATPGGAAGVIARFGGPGNFYLLTVDGAGVPAVQLWRDGAPYPVQTGAALSGGAGQANRLAVADDGAQLRFYVNQILVAEVVDPPLPLGRPGLAVVAAGEQAAAVDFDWIAIYRPAQ
jgi:hypothetical protein